MKRRKFLYAGGALVCGVGVADAAGGWNLVQPTVEHEIGSGTLHRASERLVANGLGPNDERSFYARFITDTPTQQLFPQRATDGSDTEFLQSKVTGVDFDTSFILLIQARMRFQDRYSLVTQGIPQWVGWQFMSIEFGMQDWGKVQPELVGADELIATQVIRFKSKVAPKSGRALIYNPESGDQVQHRISI